jgi:TatD DNase family protein
MLIDTHAHLFFAEYNDDFEEMLARAHAAGVGSVVIPGTDLATSRQAVSLAERYPQLYACVGIHPHEAGKLTPEIFSEIERLSEHPRVVAIGEIGLDYHYDFAPHDVQQRVFADHIALAIRRNLPIVIHSREAEPDTIRIVELLTLAAPGWRVGSGGSRGLRGVFHCFPGDTAMAQRVIDIGFVISFPGPVTFPARAAKPNLMHDVVTAIPLENILLETDSPYLTPVPHRGKRNEPSYLPIIAQTVAVRKNITVAAVADRTTRTAHELFGIPIPL